MVCYTRLTPTPTPEKKEKEKQDFSFTSRVFGAVVFSAMSAGEASSFAPDYGKAKAAAARILRLLDQQPAIDTQSAAGETLVKKVNSVSTQILSNQL